MDGSSGHSSYKQVQPGDQTTINLGRNLISMNMTALSIIDLVTGKSIWRNSTPGSPFSCRPIKLIFEKGWSSFYKCVCIALITLIVSVSL